MVLSSHSRASRLLLLAALLCGLGLGVLPLFLVNQVVHGHNGLLSVPAVLRTASRLILAFVELGPHRLLVHNITTIAIIVVVNGRLLHHGRFIVLIEGWLLLARIIHHLRGAIVLHRCRRCKFDVFRDVELLGATFLGRAHLCTAVVCAMSATLVLLCIIRLHLHLFNLVDIMIYI